LKIAYFTHQYFPLHVGGTEVYTHGLAARASKAGHAVRVITHVETSSLDVADYRAVHTQHDGVPLVELHHNLSRAAHPARAEFDNCEVAQLLKHELEADKPDLVHAVHAMKLSGAALSLCFDLKIPVVLTLADYWFICPRHTLLRWNEKLCAGPAHDLDCATCLNRLHGFAPGAEFFPAGWLRLGSRAAARIFGQQQTRFWRDLEAIRNRQPYLKRIFEQADRVIALSDFQKQMFVTNGFSEDKIQVLHHGLDVQGLRPATGQQRHSVKIIYVGSLVYHKGPHILLQALARNPDLKVSLDLYGDATSTDSYVDSLKQLAAADQRVRLMGTFAPSEMGRVLESADALAMPALWYENEPLVVKAARYVGLPVLASDIGSLSDSMRDGEHGRLLTPGDVNAWAEALKSFRPGVLPPDLSVKTIDDNARELFAIYEEIYSNKCAAQNI